MKHIGDESVLSRMFLSVFITTSIIELTNVGAGFIDGVITSRMLGPDSMAAEGIVHAIFSFVGVISGVFSIGMRMMNTISLARGNVKEVRQRFSMVVLVSGAASVICCLIMYFGAEPIAMLMGARGNAAELLEESAAYLKGLSIGSISLIMYIVFASSIEMESGSRYIEVSGLVGFVADIVLDIAAVKLGLGLWGMGLATSLSSYISLAIILAFFTKKERTLRFDFSSLPWNEIRNVCSLGSLKVFRRIANAIRPVCLNPIIIAAGGALGMSALSIQNNFINLIEIPMTGIAGATAVLTGIAYGERNKEECLRIAKIAHRYTYIYSITTAIIICLLATTIAEFYVTEPGELRNLVTFALYISAIGLPAATLLENRISYLQASFQIKKSLILTLVVRLFAVVPIACVCVLMWDSRGVIASFTLSNIIVCIGILVVYIIHVGENRMPTPEEYMDLPEDFDIPPQDIIELTVADIYEASLTAEQIQLFCKGHKIDAHRAYRAALCIQEILDNIIEHGFSPNKQNQPIDVRVTIIDDDLIIRVRDYCHQFDITKQFDIAHNDEDLINNIGVRIIEAEAKDVKYVNLVESNTVIITV